MLGGLNSFSAADVMIDTETHTDTIDRFIEKEKTMVHPNGTSYGA